MFFLLTAVQNYKKKSNEFFQSYDHNCTATFFMKHSVLLLCRITALAKCGLLLQTE